MFNIKSTYTAITFDGRTGGKVSEVQLTRFNNGQVVGHTSSDVLSEISKEVYQGKTSGVIECVSLVTHWGLTGVVSEHAF